MHGLEDGHVKFWKKMQRGVEFVKHFHAHVGPIADVAASFDGLWLATTGDDGAAKLYDVHAFDMACILRTKRDAAEPYVPGAACWLQTAAAPTPRVALAAADEAAPIRVYAAPTFALVAKLRVHASPVVALCPLPPLGLVVSADARGVLECWRCADGPRRGDDGKGAAVSEVPAEAPGDAVAYRSKLDTDLYALAKARAGPCRISASSDGARFAVTASDATIRIFETRTGRCLRLLDESAAAIDARRGAWLLRRARARRRTRPTTRTTPVPCPSPPRRRRPARRRRRRRRRSPRDAALRALVALDDLSYGRRSAAEREIQAQAGRRSFLARWNAVFDETGHYLLYGSIVGVCVYALDAGRVVAVLGAADEAERFGCLALFEGAAKLDAQMEQARRQVADSPQQGSLTMGAEQSREGVSDPTCFASSFRRKRFYLLSRHAPDAPDARDVQNELPTADELGRRAAASRPALLGVEATLRTTMGDVRFRLFGNECPKTVENFCAHARDGYYDGLIFHRVLNRAQIEFRDTLLARHPIQLAAVRTGHQILHDPDGRSAGRRHRRREHLGRRVPRRIPPEPPARPPLRCPWPTRDPTPTGPSFRHHRAHALARRQAHRLRPRHPRHGSQAAPSRTSSATGSTSRTRTSRSSPSKFTTSLLLGCVWFRPVRTAPAPSRTRLQVRNFSLAPIRMDEPATLALRGKIYNAAGRGPRQPESGSSWSSSAPVMRTLPAGIWWRLSRDRRSDLGRGRRDLAGPRGCPAQEPPLPSLGHQDGARVRPDQDRRPPARRR